MRDCSPVDTLSDILMDVPDMVFAYSDEGRYLFVNRAAADFLDADPIDLIGCHWRELGYSEEVMVPLTDQVSEVYETGEPKFYDTRSSAERGNRLLSISLTPISCEDSGTIAVLAIARDVTDYAAEQASRTPS